MSFGLTYMDIRVVAVGNSTIKIPLMPNSRTLTDDFFKRLVASLIENQATHINDQRFNLSFSVVKHITQKEHCCWGRGGVVVFMSTVMFAALPVIMLQLAQNLIRSVHLFLLKFVIYTGNFFLAK